MASSIPQARSGEFFLMIGGEEVLCAPATLDQTTKLMRMAKEEQPAGAGFSERVDFWDSLILRPQFSSFPQPYFPAGLEWTRATDDLPRGRIESCWKYFG